ncbi:GGDEF domain-containing protein [Lysobacter solisilvae (ex Woo and Kim 2020)]|uniref:diguanylate cyclase n=1 Tax=Agrilutibacter terrestris TaxID=2865112 RepID=A0A7H0FZL4_9GAMM|nr:sensor domain-containing diguanylate cyclase [Lysobacter terrestris]QNP41480.1 sensor domain-containing diguanylate cyclase [Lysobacter terrestris]
MAAYFPAQASDIEAARQAALDAYAIVDSGPERAFDDIVRLAVMLCGVSAASISLIDRDRVWFKAQVGVDQSQVSRDLSLCNHAIDQPGRTLVIDDLDLDPIPAAKRRRLGGRPPRFYAGVPLLSPDGHPLGTLSVADVEPRHLTSAQVEGLELLARQTQHLLELRRLMLEQGQQLSAREAAARHAEQARAELQRRHEELLRSATRDPLTGLLNRAAMEEMLAETLTRDPSERTPYTLLLLDIDHFKLVNDVHGHLAGDQALRAVADAVTESIRKSDIAVRFGGEEILVYLPGSALDGAAEVAYRIRERVAHAPLPFAVTVSIGIAAGDPRRDLPEQTFDRADQALYRAKAGGRDRVAVDDTPRFISIDPD